VRTRAALTAELTLLAWGGNGEVIKIALSLAKQTYVVEEPTETPEYKAAHAGVRSPPPPGAPPLTRQTPDLPFGQWPLLKLGGGEVVAQTMAILRRVGRDHGMYGKSAEEDARIDQVLEALRDVMGKLTDLRYTHKYSDEGKKDYASKYLDKATVSASHGCSWHLIEAEVARHPGSAAGTAKPSIADAYLRFAWESLLFSGFSKDELASQLPRVAEVAAKVEELAEYCTDAERPKAGPAT